MYDIMYVCDYNSKNPAIFCKPLYLLNGVLLTPLNSGGLDRLSPLHMHVVNVFL